MSPLSSFSASRHLCAIQGVLQSLKSNRSKAVQVQVSLSLSLSVSLPSKKPTFLANSCKQNTLGHWVFSESNRNSQDKRVMQHPLKHLFFLSAPAITIHTGARIPPEAALVTFHSFTCEAETLNLLDQFNPCAAVKKKRSAKVTNVPILVDLYAHHLHA